MLIVPRLTLLAMLIAVPLCCNAEDEQAKCRRDEVAAHVRQQYLVYGPQSIRNEYFGFIYSVDGVIGSAITRGNICPEPSKCGINTRAAGARIPAGAKVLGEWHTHPLHGSTVLSKDDVTGAYGNRRIGCYVAFYSKPNGEIFAWDPKQTSVPTAMASRVLIGRYSTQLAGTTSGEVKYAAPSL